jgi:hypothetical protein
MFRIFTQPGSKGDLADPSGVSCGLTLHVNLLTRLVLQAGGGAGQMTEIAWYWHFLGLKPGANKAEIKSAYHRLAKLLHRDHGGTDEDSRL